METNKTKNTDLFLIDPRNIVVVDGFNVRRDFDLDELKEQIKAKGVLNPLTVIAFKDDEGNEKYNWWMVNAGIGLPCWLYPRVRIFLMFVP